MAGGVSFSISVSGLNELIGRLRGVNSWLRGIMEGAMKASLELLGDYIPPYPPERIGQKYFRTERLGRSMGSGFGGGRTGRPDVFEVNMSGNSTEGTYGTRVGYAEYVIGEGTQAWMHVGRWWTVKTVLNNATKAIEGIWSGVGDRIAAYINGR